MKSQGNTIMDKNYLTDKLYLKRNLKFYKNRKEGNIIKEENNYTPPAKTIFKNLDWYHSYTQPTLLSARQFGVFDAFESSITSGNFPILAVGIILITGVTIGKLLCACGMPIWIITGSIKKEEANKTLKEICLIDAQISTDEKYIDSSARVNCGKYFKYFPNQFSQEFF
ncbi:hypothetical protein M0813_04656 [Anaeramoeba flamelloides]|uniref:Uncharacterized protein n=1 Tax=Anaeramoeba flamelloides TaxID=1746091 RepID=A0ABQ8XIZ6_9EUKA|nr:hypothetical protein M0813_04656 [Anaeramoeba flamelloides]